MKVAMLISGRMYSYSNLLDLFISLNDNYENNKIFYDKLLYDLILYIKNIKIEEYIIPNDFYNNNKHNKMNGLAYYRTLSCLYNDNKCFNMAKNYSINNNISYDYFIRFRSDIFSDKLPELNKFDKNLLYCVIPINNFTLAVTDNPDGEYKNYREHCYGNISHNGLRVTGDIAIGNLKNMELYCNIYNYILNQNKLYNGNYFICFEYSITIYLYDKNINFEFFEYKYIYDNNRNFK